MAHGFVEPKEKSIGEDFFPKTEANKRFFERERGNYRKQQKEKSDKYKRNVEESIKDEFGLNVKVE